MAQGDFQLPLPGQPLAPAQITRQEPSQFPESCLTVTFAFLALQGAPWTFLPPMVGLSLVLSPPWGCLGLWGDGRAEFWVLWGSTWIIAGSQGA